ncbi:MAG: tRNA preQ1(34) S-adenosylmethionine ribosyltransferase-isomerase QueA, partial [Armatimonadota bacterium]
MRLDEFDYHLPEDRIAQTPLEPRDTARLLVVPRSGADFGHLRFHDLVDLLDPTDLLVLNETRVTAVRLAGRRPSGGPLEALVLGPALQAGPGAYDALMRPARSAPPGAVLPFPELDCEAEVLSRTDAGGRILRFIGDPDAVAQRLATRGRVPLPPYIHAHLSDATRYQTVYARVPGSAAAPTAGLHFTKELLERIQGKGVGIARVRLDVGLGTFRPIRETEDVRRHVMHEEYFDVPEETARAVSECAGRVVAVGTTSLRALESAAIDAPPGRRCRAAAGNTGIFIYPGHTFRAVDGLITNFHQPGSTLLLLVAALLGQDRMRAAYETA